MTSSAISGDEPVNENSVVIIGLPSEGLRGLSNHLGMRYLEDSLVRHVCDVPDEPHEFTREWVNDKLAGYFHGSDIRNTLVIYQTPWGFLEHQVEKVAPLPDTRDKVLFYAKRVLGFWCAYHSFLLELYRRCEDRCLLINGDQPILVDPLQAVIEKKFGLSLQPSHDARVMETRSAETSYLGAWHQVVDTIVPQCMEIYAELESCAALMGRPPEFGWDATARQEASVTDILVLLAQQAGIERALSRHGINAGEIEAQLHEIVVAREDHSQSLIKENELYLLQLHQIQKELENCVDLDRQKDRQLTDLQERLTQQASVVTDLQAKIESRTAPLARRIALGIFGPKTMGAGVSTSSTPPAKPAEHVSLDAGGRSGQIEQIRASGLFDEKWYLQTYPDVAQSGQDPLNHYYAYGVAEGRNPSAEFDTQWYLETYTDVAAANLNPLFHYILYGRAEGRRPMRPVA